jgi:predicted DNA-binding transcriptional regulator YafY
MRHCADPVFATAAQALFERRRLRMRYSPRTRTAGPDEPDRDSSPLRLTWLRGNWYLDSWCHRAEDLRRFAMVTRNRDFLEHDEPLLLSRAALLSLVRPLDASHPLALCGNRLSHCHILTG